MILASVDRIQCLYFALAQYNITRYLIQLIAHILQHHDELDKQDEQRREEYKEYELKKEHERREKLKALDEEKRKEAEEKYKEITEKMHNASKQLHHPVCGSLCVKILHVHVYTERRVCGRILLKEKKGSICWIS